MAAAVYSDPNGPLVDLFLQTLINGLLIGGILASFTYGFQLAFGVLHVIDFAIGGWVMLGGYAAYWITTLLGIDAFTSLPLVFLLFGVVGYLIGPLIYHVRTSRYARPALMALAFTFGLFVLMRGGALTLFGFTTRSVDTAVGGAVLLGPVVIPTVRLTAFLLAVAFGVLLFAFLHHTRQGLAIRAMAQNSAHAGLLGVDVRRMSAHVYALYTAASGAAGVLMGVIYSVNPEVGVRYTLFAFFVAVLAGLGSIGGVMVAALLLGILEAVVATYVGSRYSHLAVFAMLYLVLLASPQGILRRGLR